MSAARTFVQGACFVAALWGAAVALPGCAHLEKAAAKDPQRCERDPKCQSKDRANDCSMQCVDDPACMDRCRQFNQQTGAGGR